MIASLRSSFVVVTLALVACSSSSSSNDGSDGGSSGGGDSGSGTDAGGSHDSGSSPNDGGSSTGCTVTAIATGGGSDTFSFACSVSASETSNFSTVGFNGTDSSGRTLGGEIEFSGDLTAKTYMNADITATNLSITSSGGSLDWNETSSAAGDARGAFTSLVISSVGTEHDVSSSKTWTDTHGTYTGTIELVAGSDAGSAAQSYDVTITF